MKYDNGDNLKEGLIFFKRLAKLHFIKSEDNLLFGFFCLEEAGSRHTICHCQPHKMMWQAGVWHLCTRVTPITRGKFFEYFWRNLPIKMILIPHSYTITEWKLNPREVHRYQARESLCYQWRIMLKCNLRFACTVNKRFYGAVIFDPGWGYSIFRFFLSLSMSQNRLCSTLALR